MDQPGSLESSTHAFESLFARAPFDSDDLTGRPARALFSFHGQCDGEMSFKAGSLLYILTEDASVGWSLAAKTVEGSDQLEPGLVPRGFYTKYEDAAETDPPAIASPTLTTPSPSVKPEALTATDRSELATVPEAAIECELVDAAPIDSEPRELLTRPADHVMPVAPPPAPAIIPSTPVRAPRHDRGPSLPIELEYSTGHVLRQTQPSKPTHRERTPSLDVTLAAALRKSKVAAAWTTSGAAEWVIRGYDGPASEAGAQHEVDAGSGWRAQVPVFEVRVHSPEQRKAPGSRMTFTVFHVESRFDTIRPTSNLSASSSFASLPLRDSLGVLSVERRFSQFAALDAAMRRLLPLSILPALPARRYLGRFSDDFIACRRRDLERWLDRLVRHPLARQTEVLHCFLGCTEDEDFAKRFKNLADRIEARPASAFFADVSHGDFLDYEDDQVDRLARHLSLQDNISGLEIGVFSLRNGLADMSRRLKDMSRSIIDLWSAPPSLSSGGGLGVGVQNVECSWCWRDGCQDCLRMTKALQATAEALDAAGNAFSRQAATGLLPSHELSQELQESASRYVDLLETHRAALLALRTAASSEADAEHENIVSRAETVLHATTAEIEHMHAERARDYRDFATSLLDAQIEAFAAATAQLQAARALLYDDAYKQLSETGPRVAPKLEYASVRQRATASGPSPLPIPSGWTSTRATSSRWSLLG